MLPKIFLLFSITSSVMAEQTGSISDDPPQAETPQSPRKFLLYTRENPDNPQEINIAQPETIQASNLKPSRNTIVIVLGLSGSKIEELSISLCQSLLDVEDVNCLGVFEQTPPQIPVFWSSNNYHAMEADLRSFLKIIPSSGFHLRNVHLIGFGRGAHLAGMVGNGEGRIGRITALNPRRYSQGTPLRDRLDKSDACFVDVIYTAGCGSGKRDPIGHLEFYVNGGEHMPGCEETSDNLGQGDQSACDDMRSIMYYEESISNPDGFRGYSAPSYDAFQQGAGFPCPSIGCPMMGHYAASYPGITSATQRFYLNTRAEKPFSCWRYKITFRYLGMSPVNGSVAVSLEGSNGESEDHIIRRHKIAYRKIAKSPVKGPLAVSSEGTKVVSQDHVIRRGEIKPGATLTVFTGVEFYIRHITGVTVDWRSDTSAQLGPSIVTVQSGTDPAAILSFCSDALVSAGGAQFLSLCSSP